MTDRIKVTHQEMGRIVANYLGGIDNLRPLSASEQVAFDRTYEVVGTPKAERVRYTPASRTEQARLARMAASVKVEANARRILKADEATRKLIRSIMRKFGGGER